MSFLQGLFGGSNSTQTNNSASGYSALPGQLQTGFNQLGQDVSQYTNPNDPNNVARFTPIGQTAGETQAYNAINQGFAPTQQSLTNDVSMLMNPFNSSVIGGINNAANSSDSILKQNMTQAGQFGSNRQELGANDIELQRQNQIGSLLQNQYNQALGQTFNNIIPQQQQDAMNQLNAGANQRQLALQTSMAPITALQSGTSMISPFTAGGTSGGYGANTNYGGGALAPAANAGAGLAALFSDRGLKKRIKYFGIENGHKVYEFEYIGDDRRYIGVMAQEVLRKNPEAVIEIDGHLAVKYNEIGVEFRRVA